MRPAKDFACSTTSSGGTHEAGEANAEQLLTWDPDWIIAMPGKGGTDLASSNAFKPLRAVSQGNVLISPQTPLGLDGRPALGEPGDRRCLGGGDHLPGRP